MVNVPATFGILRALARPSLLLPHVVVPDIRHLDWNALQRAGVRHVVFDKDNCLTRPRRDELEAVLERAFRECLDTFGRSNVLVVSNSSGSADDPTGLGAEQLSRSLGAPVLAHGSKKPSPRIASLVVENFGRAAHPDGLVAGRNADASDVANDSANASRLGHILVVGDRISTDTVLAHRIDHSLRRVPRSQPAPPRLASRRAVAVLTTRLWSRERLGIRLLRRVEDSVRQRLARQRQRRLDGAAGESGAHSIDPHLVIPWQRIAQRADPTASPSSEPVAEALARGAVPQPTPSLLALLAAQPSVPPPVRRLLGALRALLAWSPVAWATGALRRSWLLVLRGARLGLVLPSAPARPPRRNLAASASHPGPDSGQASQDPVADLDAGPYARTPGAGGLSAVLAIGAPSHASPAPDAHAASSQARPSLGARAGSFWRRHEPASLNASPRTMHTMSARGGSPATDISGLGGRYSRRGMATTSALRGRDSDSGRAPPSPSSSSTDPAAIAFFSRLSADWWSPHGETALLHRMNPVRIEYMREKMREVEEWDETLRSVARARGQTPMGYGGSGGGPSVEGRGEASPGVAFLRGKEVVDVGCGGGLLTESLARLGADVLGIDAAQSNISIARAHAAQDPGLPLSPASRPGSPEGMSLRASMLAQPEGTPRLSYAHTTAEELLALRREVRGGAGAGHEGYDVVTAMEVVEHVAQPAQFLRDLAALVKPGGHLFLSTISRTAFSYLLTILLAEKALRLVSPGTHTHSQYIRPEELVDFFTNDVRWILPSSSSSAEHGQRGEEPKMPRPARVRYETRGVAYLPWRRAWKLAERADDYADVEAGVSVSQACNYFFWARRPF